MAIIVISSFNPKLFYQFLLSVEFANFGKYTEECANAENHCEVSVLNYAYYYFGLVIFLTLGRSNRISFLWRTIAETFNMLNKIQNNYVAILSNVSLDVNKQEVKVAAAAPMPSQVGPSRSSYVRFGENNNQSKFTFISFVLIFFALNSGIYFDILDVFLCFLCSQSLMMIRIMARYICLCNCINSMVRN